MSRTGSSLSGDSADFASRSITSVEGEQLLTDIIDALKLNSRSSCSDASVNHPIRRFHSTRREDQIQSSERTIPWNDFSSALSSSSFVESRSPDRRVQANYDKQSHQSQLNFQRNLRHSDDIVRNKQCRSSKYDTRLLRRSSDPYTAECSSDFFNVDLYKRQNERSSKYSLMSSILLDSRRRFVTTEYHKSKLPSVKRSSSDVLNSRSPKSLHCPHLNMGTGGGGFCGTEPGATTEFVQAVKEVAVEWMNRNIITGKNPKCNNSVRHIHTDNLATPTTSYVKEGIRIRPPRDDGLPGGTVGCIQYPKIDKMREAFDWRTSGQALPIFSAELWKLAVCPPPFTKE